MVRILAALAASVLVFAWPELSSVYRGVRVSYPLVTAIFTLFVVAIVAAWPRDAAAAPDATRRRPLMPFVALASALIVIIALYRWTRLAAWQPYHADMLIVIREATRRFLNGHTPYATYRSYDAPWPMVMPYGPALWGPFIVPQWLRFDFRLITIAGELFVPVWCGVAAVVAASRGRMAAAAAWIAVMATLVIALDVQQFTLIGHTPIYWPLIPLLAVAVANRRWVESACVVGMLVLARTTMVAIVPVFLMAVWTFDRRKLPLAIAVLTLTIAAVLAPFIAWDARAVWESMVLSYPRVMKSAVWPVLAKPGMETIGVTEWLIERHLEWLVTPANIVAMLGVYAAAWAAIRRNAHQIPWMALALFAFSMTTLYPVHYLYYDVLLLLVSAALAGTLQEAPARVTRLVWACSAIMLVVLTFAAMRTLVAPFPQIAAGTASDDRPLRTGFAASEHDGERDFSWIVGTDARIVLPRSSAADADIVLIAQSPFDRDRPPQRMAAVLNGTLLAETVISSGWQEIRIAAPRSSWWVGFNELRLEFSSTVSPRDIGASEDPRRLALGVSRVEVKPPRQ